ncbi:MAG: hypothetical protein IT460_17390 [Planctomycetes bacterium]|nr:hypothetical protein [Planctomycetota bacterium]
MRTRRLLLWALLVAALALPLLVPGVRRGLLRAIKGAPPSTTPDAP